MDPSIKLDAADLDRLEALHKAATPISLENIMRYDHGGARILDLSLGQRVLIADFYEEPDRECWIAARLALPALIAAARERDELLAALETLRGEIDLAPNGRILGGREEPEDDFLTFDLLIDGKNCGTFWSEDDESSKPFAEAWRAWREKAGK